MKATQPIKPVATAESKKERTDRKPAVLDEQRGRRRRAGWRSSTLIDDDWTQQDRKRGRLKDALLADWESPEAMERTQPKKPETVAESKYEPTDYERAALEKQEQRWKDRVGVPRIKFVEDEHGGRREFDHPDQAIASALLNEAFGTADNQFTRGLLHYLCAALPADESSAFEFPRSRRFEPRHFHHRSW